MPAPAARPVAAPAARGHARGPRRAGALRRTFDTDRISRRSFRRFLQNDTDFLLVATSRPGAGYILLLKHRGTRLARL
jgi:hypothetical protein